MAINYKYSFKGFTVVNNNFMTIHAFKAYVEEMNKSREWDRDRETHREKLLKFFPHTVVVEGNCREYDLAEDWLTDRFGRKGGEWNECWYGKTDDEGKTDYTYGFCEFFFKVKSVASKFRDTMGNFSTEMDVGNKRRGF